MITSYFTFRWIHFRAPKEELPALPEGIVRNWVQTPGGQIEVLSARPSSPTSKAPIVFAHGGMTGAWVWIEYMQYLSKQGIPCYAVSCRGHGSSWKPSYFRMMYFTTRRMLADDLLAGLGWAQKLEGGRDVLLVGHSSGGGLSQYVLSDKNVRVKGLALLGAVPGSGS
jgi:pimeloyl-ACP methyl ester carboxylesterase